MIKPEEMPYEKCSICPMASHQEEPCNLCIIYAQFYNLGLGTNPYSR